MGLRPARAPEEVSGDRSPEPPGIFEASLGCPRALESSLRFGRCGMRPNQPGRPRAENSPGGRAVAEPWDTGAMPQKIHPFLGRACLIPSASPVEPFSSSKKFTRKSPLPDSKSKKPGWRRGLSKETMKFWVMSCNHFLPVTLQLSGATGLNLLSRRWFYSGS